MGGLAIFSSTMSKSPVLPLFIRALENDNVDLYEIEEKNLLREILKFTGWIFRLSSENS